jgi:hypothetical protein
MRSIIHVTALCLALATLAGCNPDNPRDPGRRGVEVDAPGVKVRVQPGEKKGDESPKAKIEVDVRREDKNP